MSLRQPDDVTWEIVDTRRGDVIATFDSEATAREALAAYHPAYTEYEVVAVDEQGIAHWGSPRA